MTDTTDLRMMVRIRLMNQVRGLYDIDVRDLFLELLSQFLSSEIGYRANSDSQRYVCHTHDRNRFFWDRIDNTSS